MRVKTIAIGALIFFFANPVLSQVEDAEKLRTANNDLRGEKALFTVKSHQEVHDSLSLMVVGNDQYMAYFSKENDEPGKRVKVSNELAQKVDGEFVKKFIEFKYSMKRNNDNRCEDAFTLSMRGEEQKVCHDEQVKISQLAGLVKNLKNKLKKR